jgi:hypothetical protein
MHTCLVVADSELPLQLQPWALKGSSLMLYQTVTELGLNARVVPLINTPGHQAPDYDTNDEESSESQPGSSDDEGVHVEERLHVKERRESGPPAPSMLTGRGRVPMAM